MNERAARALGWTVGTDAYGDSYRKDVLNKGYWSGKEHKELISNWTPTTDIAQAFMLVEKCREEGLEVHISMLGVCNCTVVHDAKNWRDVKIWNIYKPTAAEAITAACTEALEVSDESEVEDE